MSQTRAVLIWALIAIALCLPLGLAALSPLLAWREPIYIIAGFAGIIAMTAMLVQPLLVIGAVPGARAPKGRRLHRWVGMLLVILVAIHVAGLWITSPPDVIDALTFTSPTRFSAWGVIAMWALFAAAVLASLRRRLGLRWHRWRKGHKALALVAVAGTVVHVLLIEGTMEPISKIVLCVLLGAAMAKALFDLHRGNRR